MVIECVDRCDTHWIKEADLSIIIVDLHPNPFQVALQVERCMWGGHGRVLPIRESDGPESSFETAWDFAFPGYWCFNHTNYPVIILAHVHLPGMTSWGETIGAQYKNKVVKALRVFRQLFHRPRVGHTRQILAKRQTGVRCVGVQRHWS